MRILFATSECVPFFKKGGLGDVSNALPVALSKIGVAMTVALPYYENAKVNNRDLTCLGPLAVDFAGKRELVFVFRTRIPETRVQVLLFRHPRLSRYDDAPFLFYCCCLSAWIKKMPVSGGTYDIVHSNDWHTALLPVILGEERKTVRKKTPTIQSGSVHTVLTIHNLMYHGIVRLSEAKQTGIPADVFHKIPSPEGGVVNLFREGLEHADVITTVSPSYAKEILTPEFGPHIYDVLKRRHDAIVGILNGIDTDVWNPKTDAYLSKTYGIADVPFGKSENKRLLQKAVGLPRTDDLLFGFVGRIEPRQKGVDLIIKAVRAMPRKKFQVVLLGTGDVKQVKELETIDKNREHIAYVSTFDERLARRIFGGSDILLVPSKFEPCGLTQMIAMRYGSIPLVRKTGGLADSVTDGKTGFVFDDYRVESLCRVMWKAIALREDEPHAWRAMVRRVMKEDFSWVRSAKEYVGVYKKVLESTT